MGYALIIIYSLIIILAALFLILYLKRARKAKKQEIEEKQKQEFLKKNLGLNREIKNPKESLLTLNKIAREFFREYLRSRHEENFTEIEEALKKKKHSEAAKFCEDMNYLLYSGKPVKKEDAIKMINDFDSIMSGLKK
jgi:biopolymer transport protein ExbB/TolQ